MPVRCVTDESIDLVQYIDGDYRDDESESNSVLDRIRG